MSTPPEDTPKHRHAEIPKSEKTIINAPAPSISYFHPVQQPPPGTFLTWLHNGSKTPPMLFRPLRIRGQVFHNRIWVSPMCQYSSFDGQLTDWHVAQLGNYAARGASLVMAEAAAVTPGGRTTPEDAGLWKDEQIPSFRRVVEAIHSQGQKAACQLAHAGRKASMVAPWLGVHIASPEAHGFADAVVAPSAIAHSAEHAMPLELSLDAITEIIESFATAAQRAMTAGFDVIEIHAAHGYLIHEFLSPVSNKRTDSYGGSFENRARFATDLVRRLRQTIPPKMPLFFRLSASDCLEGRESWNILDTVKLSALLRDLGVDLIDVSSGGIHKDQVIAQGPGYQAQFAKSIKTEVDDILVGSVGMLHQHDVAYEVLESGTADAIFIGREFSRDPSYVLRLANELGIKVKWPIQLHRAEPSYKKRYQTNL